ncbi:MAG: response regulator [Chloroflexota bacterium]|nr:response regulator [Chloroflexota bacterium]
MERKIKLLIVDDERGIRTTFGEFFEKRGFDVELAADGKQGLNKLREGEFDVAIVDLRMPEMSGSELTRHAVEEGIDTSLIILTGHGDRQDAIQAINLGVGGWFEKTTVKMDDLLHKVNELAQVIPLDEVRRILSAIPEEEM